MKGFQMFDEIHWMWLIITVIFLFLSLYLYNKSNKRIIIQKIIFFSLLSLEVSKQLFLLITDNYNYWSPPLHLCGLGIFIIGIHTYKPNIVTNEILFALTLPGAIAALVLPGWTNSPLFGYIHFNSFIFHILLVTYVTLLLSTKEIIPKLKLIRFPIVFLLIIVPPIYFYNKAFKTNFMFINKPLPNTPLELFEQWFGNPGYLFGFALLVIALWAIQYFMYYVITYKSRGALNEKNNNRFN